MENTTTKDKRSYTVLGMTCAACAISIETLLETTAGIDTVAVSYPNKSLTLTHTNEITIEEVQKKTKAIGYDLVIGEETDVKKKVKQFEENQLKQLQLKLIVAAIFSLPIFVMAMFFMGKVPYENWIMFALSLPVLFYSGAEFYSIAWKKMLHFSANMDTLVALSTGVAFLFSLFNTIYPQYYLAKGVVPHVYYESAVIIIAFILLGRFLEEKAKSKTSSAIKKLMGLRPKFVTVLKNGEEQQIAINELVKGDLIVVKPGEKIAIDGKVKKGNSFIDESMISGEPIPVEKTKGSFVFSGTINQKGALRILATKVGNDTLLSQIIKQVTEAQNSKPKIQKLADTIAGIFVPIVIGLAILTFIIWYIFGPEPTFSFALLSLITVLIIACPCALGLATPTALMVGIGKGATKGILIKDAQVLETAYKTDVLVLDKTGTITKGKPDVTDMLWSNDINISLTKEIVLAIESQSEHPIAGAIVAHLKKENLKIINTNNFKSYTGMGASATYNDTNYAIGNQKLMQSQQFTIANDLEAKAKEMKLAAKTVVYIGTSGTVVGLIAVADELKESAAEAIKKIQKMGIEIHMLTGDTIETAKIIANAVGIKHYQASVMPADKGNFIEKLQQEGKIVAMAGDGINDAHALAQADVGIAMQSGTDIAMESAGITLMHSDLNQIAKAISLSKVTMKTIKQNLFWAFIYNIIAIPIAAGVLYPAFEFLLNPMLAGAAMAMSSISVLANSLRLKNKTI